MHGMVLVCSSLIHARLCDSVDSHPPGSSVHGILQTRILEWVTIPFSTGSSQLRDQTQVSCTGGRFSTIWATREAHLIIKSDFFFFKRKSAGKNP